MARLEYSRRYGTPSGWGHALFSVLLGCVGLTAVGHALYVVSTRSRIAAVFDDPVLAFGCCFWLLAPIGAAAGALVLDERPDVVRMAKLGIIFNVIALVAAAVTCYRGWQILDFD